MSDHLTIEQRHKNMVAVRSKDTKPDGGAEILVEQGVQVQGE